MAVPPNRAEVSVEALRRQGIPVFYRTYEGEDHGSRRSDTSRDLLEREPVFHDILSRFTPSGTPRSLAVPI